MPSSTTHTVETLEKIHQLFNILFIVQLQKFSKTILEESEQF